MVEPPPVYSSLNAIDKIQLRGEDTKKKKRSLFLSPFTFCIGHKKFATIHASVSLAFCTIGVIYCYASLGKDQPVKNLVIDCCLPSIPFFISALFGIRRNKPNFVLVAAAYMMVCSLIFFIPATIWICYNIPFLFGDTRDWAILGIVPVLIFVTPALLYTSHAFRVYLRNYFDIRDERKERNQEIKLPLV